MSAITVCEAPTSTGVKSVSNDTLKDAIEVLSSGQAIKLLHHPLMATGAYSDPYVCAYYPLHYLRVALVKSGFASKATLKIKTSKQGKSFDARLFMVGAKNKPSSRNYSDR